MKLDIQNIIEYTISIMIALFVLTIVIDIGIIKCTILGCIGYFIYTKFIEVENN